MKKEAVRTTVDIPAPLYRKLKEQAAAQGRSVRELILSGVQTTLLQGKASASAAREIPSHLVRGAEGRTYKRTNL